MQTYSMPSWSKTTYESTQATNLTEVKAFLQDNGFNNTRNNDYFHPELGVILEDLHDENVLTAHEILYFIDTVFYIKSDLFWHLKKYL